MATTTRLTAAEYLAEEEDGRRTELIDGEVIVHEPKWWHQRILGLLYARLLAWTEAAPGRGTVTLPLDVGIDEYTVLAPDVLWFREGRDPRPSGAQELPDLAVEIRSPTTWRYDVGRKKSAYEREGLSELWLVDLGAVLVYRRSEASASGFDVELELAPSDRLGSPLLPGFGLELRELYEEAWAAP